jgi:hypothetical protein
VRPQGERTRTETPLDLIRPQGALARFRSKRRAPEG